MIILNTCEAVKGLCFSITALSATAVASTRCLSFNVSPQDHQIWGIVLLPASPYMYIRRAGSALWLRSVRVYWGFSSLMRRTRQRNNLAIAALQLGDQEDYEACCASGMWQRSLFDFGICTSV